MSAMAGAQRVLASLASVTWLFSWLSHCESHCLCPPGHFAMPHLLSRLKTIARIVNGELVSGESAEGGVKLVLSAADGSKIEDNDWPRGAAKLCPLEAINLLNQIKNEIDEK